MSSALDQAARTALERFVQRARGLLEEDLAREAEGRFGIHAADGQVEDEEGLHLDPAGVGVRRDVVEILDFLRREEPTGAEAVGRLIREAAFTHLNRLVAIRIAEAIQLLPESLARGSASTGFKELLEVAPLLAHDASGGYWRYLQLCGDELAADLPQLFDPRNPLLELAPSPAAFDNLVEMVGATDLNHVWDAPDALGWAYQFFNSGDARRAMRDASASPRNSRELAVRNQFFTPRYVVDFLVHNSLGRRLLEADPTSGLEAHLPVLLDPPTEPGAPLALTDVRVLDPACGSGHFLLGAYDVLEHAWELQGISPENAAPHIVSSLWGIDIDARCAQVAAAAVIFRARRFCKTHDLPAPNIITARALPEPAEGWEALLASLPPDRRRLVTSIRNALDRAPVLGPLLKVEELLATEIRSHVVGADDDPSTLFGVAGIANDAFGRAETDVLQVLQGVADRATSGPADRLFAAEAQDAIRFVDAMRNRYDAVLMNPPFGEPVAETKDYLKAAYPWIPTRDYNLLAAFVGRGLELCNAAGSTGAITSRACMFLKTFEDFRMEILLGFRMGALADLGFGVMEQALVEAAAYVIDARPAGSGDRATFVRLLKENIRGEALLDSADACRRGIPDGRVFRVGNRELASVPGSPLAYWMSPSIRRLFTDFAGLEGGGTSVRVGLQTGDDFRFLRAAWEVSAESIVRTPEHAREGERWVPFAKGGEYSPYWSDIHLLVDWHGAGKSLAAFPGSVIRNPQFYFRPGLTWPPRTASGFAPRVLPQGCIFGHKGPGVFSVDDSALTKLAWLNSRLVQACMDSMVAAGEETSSGGAARSYEVGLVQKLPWPGKPLESETLAGLVDEIVRLRRDQDLGDETTASFVGPVVPPSGASVDAAAAVRIENEENHALRILDATRQLDDLISTAVGLDVAGSRYLDDEVGPHPSGYGSAVPDIARFAWLYRGRIEGAIDELIEERGGARAIANLTYFADRRLEVLAHGLEVTPEVLVAERRRLNLLPPEEPARTAADLLSYLVGLAFGRWDVRVGIDPTVARLLGDPFEVRAPCSPGMLVDENGLPARDSPVSYPLSIPTDGLLLDEPGYEWDIEMAVLRAAESLLGSSDAMVADLIDVLGSRSMRSHFRTKFFKDHLSRYSKSRRQAPIYWPLTVPSGQWGVWLYAPSFSRESLYAVAAEALRREGHAQAEVSRLERERVSDGSGRGAKALDKALDDERKLGEELRRFRQEAERIAGLGWEPDLDDGIVLCAAPVADLFPMWKEPARYRKELRAGKYEWSTVSKWADQL